MCSRQFFWQLDWRRPVLAKAMAYFLPCLQESLAHFRESRFLSVISRLENAEGGGRKIREISAFLWEHESLRLWEGEISAFLWEHESLHLWEGEISAFRWEHESLRLWERDLCVPLRAWISAFMRRRSLRSFESMNLCVYEKMDLCVPSRAWIFAFMRG